MEQAQPQRGNDPVGKGVEAEVFPTPTADEVAPQVTESQKIHLCGLPEHASLWIQDVSCLHATWLREAREV